MPSNEDIRVLKKQLEDHDKRISRLESLLQAKPKTVVVRSSARDFVRLKKPKTDLQKTLAIGCYLERHEGLSSFNVRDLDTGFRDAKEPVPGNLNDMINKNKEKGYIMDAKEKKDKLAAYILTNKGEEYVDSDFKEQDNG